jgi:hypothetical protein
MRTACRASRTTDRVVRAFARTPSRRVTPSTRRATVLNCTHRQSGLVLRYFLLCVLSACLISGSSAGADDYSGPSGYGTSSPNYQFDVAHDGYGGVGHPLESAEPATYRVLEVDAGTSTEIEGETVVVMQEPDPIAATTQAPPPPRVAPSDQQAVVCPNGVWVDGYWDYRDGQYVWVDGHCVEVRVDYVFVPPRWDFYWDIWWFIPGYYRPCDAFVGFGYYRPWDWFPPYPHPYYRSGRAIPVSRGIPKRPTVARPAPAPREPSVTRVPRHSTTVIHGTPSGATRPVSLGRAGTGPVLTEEGLRSRHGVGIVTQPQFHPRPVTGARRQPASRSRGFSGERPRTRPSSRGTGWQPSSGSSSGSSRGWTGGRTRSAPSTGGRGRGSSGDRHGGGFGRGRSE